MDLSLSDSLSESPISIGHSVLFSATHHPRELSLHDMVGLPSQIVSWFESRSERMS